jgi:hypothetical protein
MVEVKKYIFFGRIDILIQAAPDPGIVTTLALVSPDGDEINFEWTGADDKTVQTNWFSKGNTSMRDRVGYHPINRSSTAFHAYSISWGTKRIQWSVDDAVVRTLNYRKEDDGTSNGFPYVLPLPLLSRQVLISPSQAPMNIRIGCWVAGGRHASPGNLEWSGGAAGFTSGPKRAYIKSLNVTDDAYNITGSQPSQPKFYTWKDLSGFYHNISAMYDNPSTGNGTAGSTPAPLNPNAPVFSGGLGTGGIAGIIVGFVAAFSVIGFLAIVVLAQRRKRAKKEEDDAASAKEMELRNMSVEEVGGVDNKPELDGNVLAEMSGDSDKEAQELDGKWDALFEMSEDNNPQELSPAESHESEEMYYEKLRAAVTGMKKPRDDLPEGKDERSV